MDRIKQKAGWFLIPLVVFLLDQITKNMAVANLTHTVPSSFLPYFNFTLLYNEGAAFSFLDDAGGWQRWFFTIIATVVSIVIAVWMTKLPNSKKWELTGLALILGGAIGNLYDRVLLGKVVDFVDWFYPAAESCLPFFYRRTDVLDTLSCHWPAFNIADAAILAGAACLIIDAFFIKESDQTIVRDSK